MIIVSIDPGSLCGWAVLKGKRRLKSGVWDCRPKPPTKTRPKEHPGKRYSGLNEKFDLLLEDLKFTHVDAVAIEDVKRHAGVIAAHVYGGIVGVIAAAAYDFDIPVVWVGVGTAKKHATGHGSASKEMMISAARKRWRRKFTSSDECDALWIADTCRVALEDQ